MKGILLLSHGPLAYGMFETAKWFMGEDICQFDYICLEPKETFNAYDIRIKEKMKQVDTGEGVIIFVDLLGGTPCNRCIQFISESVQVISGMNLTLVLEQLGGRLSDIYDYADLIQAGKDGVCNINDFIADSE